MIHLQYLRALDFDISPLTVQIRDGAINDIWQEFVGNLQQIHLLLDFPARSYKVGEVWRQSELSAAKEMGYSDVHGITDPVQRDALVRRIEELFAVVARQVAFHDYTRANIEQAIANIEGMGTQHRIGITEAAQATLAVAVLRTWTVFEMLATDVWVEIVNTRPDTLGQGAIGKLEKGRRSFQIDTLGDYDYDLRGKLGTYLKDEKRYTFNQLNDIQAAYLAVFEEHIDGTFKGKDHQNLHWLEALRNVLAHRHGKADKRFRERMDKHSDYSKLEIGDPVPIDGFVVSANVNVVIRAGAALVKYVQEWLECNPVK